MEPVGYASFFLAGVSTGYLNIVFNSLNSGRQPSVIEHHRMSF